VTARRFTLVLLAGLGSAVQGAAAAGNTLVELDKVGRSIAEEKCARPLEVKVSFVRNPHARDVADEMKSTTCRGFRVATYRSLSPDPPRELPMSVVVEAAHRRVDSAWSVGTPSAIVRAALGVPFSTQGESFSYSLSPSRPGQDTLAFEVQAGVVRAVTWSWEID